MSYKRHFLFGVRLVCLMSAFIFLITIDEIHHADIDTKNVRTRLGFPEYLGYTKDSLCVLSFQTYEAAASSFPRSHRGHRESNVQICKFVNLVRNLVTIGRIAASVGRLN